MSVWEFPSVDQAFSEVTWTFRGPESLSLAPNYTATGRVRHWELRVAPSTLPGSAYLAQNGRSISISLFLLYPAGRSICACLTGVALPDRNPSPCRALRCSRKTAAVNGSPLQEPATHPHTRAQQKARWSLQTGLPIFAVFSSDRSFLSSISVAGTCIHSPPHFPARQEPTYLSTYQPISLPTHLPPPSLFVLILFHYCSIFVLDHPKQPARSECFKSPSSD